MKKLIIVAMLLCCSVAWGEENNYVLLTDTALSFEPSTRIIFSNMKEEAYIDWKDGKLIAGGNMDKSAEIFFKHYIKVLVDEYIREKLKSNFSPKNRSY